MAQTDTWIEAAGRWFLHSGIQEESGGVARYYRSDLAQNAKVSTEITGYVLGALLFLHQRLGQTEYLDAALRAARFLARSAWNRQLCTFPFELPSNGAQSGFSYFLDCGIIVRGLVAAWRVTNDAELLNTAIAAGRAMLADFRSRDAIHPILALPEKSPLPYEPRWSRSPGCYQLKSAMAWHDLFEATGEASFERAYESAVDLALQNQHEFLPGEPDREKVMDRLHAYSYFLEGLLPALARRGCREALQSGVQRAATYLREIAPQFARSDVYAQVLRVRMLAETLGGFPLDHAAAAEEAREASSFQLHSPDPRIAGGFGFGRKAREVLPFVNPVSTAFCIQALAWWEDRKSSLPSVQPQSLI